MFRFLTDMNAGRKARGLTLIELMVALAIISLLAGIALPTIKETLQGQRLSRAASVLQAIIQEGQSRSIVRGGGSGILIQRLSDTDLFGQSASVLIRLVDSPAAYRGDTPMAEARYQYGAPNINDPTLDNHYLLFDDQQIQMMRSADDIQNLQIQTLINIGNTISLGDEALEMRIESMVKFTGGTAAPGFDWSFWQRTNEAAPAGFPNDFVMVEVEPNNRNMNFRRHGGSNVSFTVTRSPRFAIAPPLVMPTGTAIDLTASGIGRYGNDFSPSEIFGNYTNTANPPFANPSPDCQSIMILFGSRGEVSRVLTGRWNGTLMVVDDLQVTGTQRLADRNDGEEPLALALRSRCRSRTTRTARSGRR